MNKCLITLVGALACTLAVGCTHRGGYPLSSPRFRAGEVVIERASGQTRYVAAWDYGCDGYTYQICTTPYGDTDAIERKRRLQAVGQVLQNLGNSMSEQPQVNVNVYNSSAPLIPSECWWVCDSDLSSPRVYYEHAPAVDSLPDPW